MIQSVRPITFADLMAKLGFFLFHWATLEAQLPASIRRMRKELGVEGVPLPSGLAKRLDLWQDLALAHPHDRALVETVPVVRAQTLALRDIRNTIVHGLHTGDAMQKVGPPYIACHDGGADRQPRTIVHYSLDDLEHFLQAADACSRAFEHLPNFNYRLDRPPSPPEGTTSTLP